MHLNGQTMASLFYEPSTRTRFSFEAAMYRLGGGHVITTENAREFSSLSKGETLEDTIRIVNGYVDLIVLRHPQEGSAKRAAAVAEVPLINAGDGSGQHPTQALLDLYTIERHCRRLGRPLAGFRVALVGDLKHGRTARSLAYLLARYEGVTLDLVAPEAYQMGQDLLEFLERRGVPYRQVEDLEGALEKADCVYMTRLQKERHHLQQDPLPRQAQQHHLPRQAQQHHLPRQAQRQAQRQALWREEPSQVYHIGTKEMAILRQDAILMHPLPRVGEIDPAVDGDPRAVYFEQAHGGLWIRMALILYVLGKAPYTLGKAPKEPQRKHP